MSKNFFKWMCIAVTVQILLIFTGDTAFTQRMRMSVDERIKTLSDQLSLTKPQIDSIRKIYQDADTLRTKTFGGRQGDRSSMREMMRKIQDSTDAKIELLLTKEQKEKFFEIKKKRMQRNGPPPPPPQD